MKPGRSSYVTFLGATLDYRESKQIEPAILDEMVTKLREGDKSQIEPIILGHLRMVMAIVADNARGAKAQDIEGAAFLALVEAVNNSCPHTDKDGVFQDSRLYDNNITYYITTTVKYAIKDEYSNSHVLRMPARTIRHKIANGEEYKDLVPGMMSIAEDKKDDGNGEEDTVVKNGLVLPFMIPIAPIQFPAIEFTDALNRCVENEMERAIVKLRSEGYTYEEVGKKVGFTAQRISQIMPGIEKRFDRLMK